eukprot:TRINITY_DN25604_c0_g2_i1.p1 TRINITY_DN25604_c0_g2~~TRINITY_DN25604_c0_g2_i1.p1  ORF type:complete len:313 (-),score=26.95 TRINITY_DN25604_c0_g2_i1:145-1041(-)
MSETDKASRNTENMEKIKVLFARLEGRLPHVDTILLELIPQMLVDLFDVEQTIPILLGEFVNAVQKSKTQVPMLLARMVFRTLKLLCLKGSANAVQEWVLMSLDNFFMIEQPQKKLWALSCLFLAAAPRFSRCPPQYFAKYRWLREKLCTGMAETQLLLVETGLHFYRRSSAHRRKRLLNALARYSDATQANAKKTSKATEMAATDAVSRLPALFSHLAKLCVEFVDPAEASEADIKEDGDEDSESPVASPVPSPRVSMESPRVSEDRSSRDEPRRSMELTSRPEAKPRAKSQEFKKP